MPESATTVVTICPWCVVDVPIPHGVYMDGDPVGAFLCPECGEPLQGKVYVCVYPAHVARLVERAVETGSWISEADL